MEYSSLKYTELIALCKKRGISGYSNKKKVELINMLEEHDWIFVTNSPYKQGYILSRVYYFYYNKQYPILLNGLLYNIPGIIQKMIHI